MRSLITNMPIMIVKFSRIIYLQLTIWYKTINSSKIVSYKVLWKKISIVLFSNLTTVS